MIKEICNAAGKLAGFPAPFSSDLPGLFVACDDGHETYPFAPGMATSTSRGERGRVTDRSAGQQGSASSAPQLAANHTNPEAAQSRAATRIALRPHDPGTGEEIDKREIAKGYEYGRGQFVTLTPEELKALDVESSKVIDLEKFAPRGDLDPVYFQSSYYLYPDGPIAVEALRVIGAAMAEGELDAEMVAIAKTIIAQRTGSLDPTSASRLSCSPSPGVGNGTHRPPPSPPLPPQGGASKRLSDPNSLLRDPSRRVVRVEIGHKPGVFRGTGSSNPVPSSEESANRAILPSHGEKPAFARGFRYCSYRSVTTRNNFVQISDKTFSFSEYLTFF